MTVTVGDISIMSTSVCVPSKRKDSGSPRVLKRKYLRRVVVPSLAAAVFPSLVYDNKTRPASASLGVPVKKMKANNSEMTSWKYQHEIPLPILTVNGELVSLENEDESPSPAAAKGMVGVKASHLLALEQFTPVSESEALPPPVSPSMTHKKKVSSPRFFRKKNAKKAEAPSISLLTYNGKQVGPENPLESSYYQDRCQKESPFDLPSQATMAGDQSLVAQSNGKESASSKGLRKKNKSFRNIILPLMTHKNGKGKCIQPESEVESPSAFEQELADQENQSPNDPEFVRRASQRWQRKTGAINYQYCQMFSPFGCRDHVLPVQYTKFEWPTSPSQQPAFQRRVSPVHYMESPFAAPPPLPVQGNSRASSPFQRSSRLYSSMIEQSAEFQRASHCYSSMKPNKSQWKISCPERSKAEISSENTPAKTKKTSIHLPFVRRSLTHVRKLSKTRSIKVQLKSLDDSVAAEVRRVAMREELQVARQALLQRLSVRVRGSLQVPQRKTSQTSLTVTPSVTASASYQSYLCSLSGLSRDSSFSSTSPPSSPSLASSPSLSSSASQGHLTLQDIFIAEPKIAEKYAIMFPTEPRPEWHRHLRHVIHKAGQKIFKKPEQHDTTIPDNLRYQLKYIYVY